MKTLATSILVFILLSFGLAQASAPRHAPSSDVIYGWIHETYGRNITKEDTRIFVKEAQRHALEKNLPIEWIIGIVAAESSFRKHAENKGSVGIAQVYPKAHPDKIKGVDLFTIVGSMHVGMQVFQNCMKRQKGNIERSLMCYNGNFKEKGVTYIGRVRDQVNLFTAYAIKHLASIKDDASVNTAPSMSALESIKVALNQFIVSVVGVITRQKLALETDKTPKTGETKISLTDQEMNIKYWLGNQRQLE